MTDLDKPCVHKNFDALVNVAVIGEAETSDGMPKAYSAEVTIKCASCSEPFRFIGFQAGLRPDMAMVSPNEEMIRLPIRPASSDPDFGLGIPGFSINYRGTDG